MKLTDYFSPKKIYIIQDINFLKMRTHIGESAIAYAVRLQEKAVNREFHDDRLLEHIIQKSDSYELIRKVLHEMDTATNIGRMQVLEDTYMQVEAMSHQNNIEDKQ